jgi:hypothetical protein
MALRQKAVPGEEAAKKPRCPPGTRRSKKTGECETKV